jgi:hypothetical protein
MGVKNPNNLVVLQSMGEGHAARGTYGIFTRANMSSLPAHRSLFKLDQPCHVCGGGGGDAIRDPEIPCTVECDK